MNVVVATDETQGQREDDFSWTTPGEIVVLPRIGCTCRGLDCACHWRFSFSGLSTLRWTTTAQIVEIPEVVLADLIAMARDWIDRQNCSRTLSPELLQAEAKDLAMGNAATARQFSVGAIIERRHGGVFQRSRTRVVYRLRCSGCNYTEETTEPEDFLEEMAISHLAAIDDLEDVVKHEVVCIREEEGNAPEVLFSRRASVELRPDFWVDDDSDGGPLTQVRFFGLG